MNSEIKTITAAHAAVYSLAPLTESQRIAIRLNDWREAATALVNNPMHDCAGLRGVQRDVCGEVKQDGLNDCNSNQQWGSPEGLALHAVIKYANAVRAAAARSASQLADAEIARRTGGQLYRREGARFVRA